MMPWEEWVEQLRRDRTLLPDRLALLVETDDAELETLLANAARSVARLHFGNGVYVRGLIEVCNYCRNGCYYCGIRSANRGLQRYRLNKVQILECCWIGYSLGFRTFVLQGGEDPLQTDDFVEEVVSAIHTIWPDCAITLSLGEKSRESYERFFRAGASRYLLRHETYDSAHYRSLHPPGMSRDNRLRCLDDLKSIGYQTGTGIMVGSPGQTVNHLVDDLLFIQRFRPQMIGIGPFLPHHATPFAHEPAGNLRQTLRLLSILRLMHPLALIPSTTALATLSPEGRTRGILAGANVVMPNLSPSSLRSNYALYDDKACLGAESAEGIAQLQSQLESIGYRIDWGRGDFGDV